GAVKVETRTTDAFGGVTLSTALQYFGVHKDSGQAKLTRVMNSSTSTSADGSVTDTQPYEIRYTYQNKDVLNPETIQVKDREGHVVATYERPAAGLNGSR